MLIVFKSTIKNSENDKEEVIEFSSSVNISKWNDFDVYEFKEPKMGEMNRIEVKEGLVNIFAGARTFNLVIDQDIKIAYESQMGIMYLVSRLNKQVIKENKILFEYTLHSENKELIGLYKIELNIKK